VKLNDKTLYKKYNYNVIFGRNENNCKCEILLFENIIDCIDTTQYAVKLHTQSAVLQKQKTNQCERRLDVFGVSHKCTTTIT